MTAYIKYPENFDDLHRRLPELADASVTFTGSMRDMLAVDDVDTVGKLVATAWDAFLVLADYVRARNAGAFDGSIKQYLEDTPQGYRQMPPNKFAERETGKTMAAWGDERSPPCRRTWTRLAEGSWRPTSSSAGSGWPAPACTSSTAGARTSGCTSATSVSHLRNTQTN